MVKIFNDNNQIYGARKIKKACEEHDVILSRRRIGRIKAEATFKSIKTEFVYPNEFETLQQLKQELAVYIWWFNNKRYHQTLKYLTPVQYRLKNAI